jgi:hypothetical protein
MFYVYVLQSADGKNVYYGFSSNPKAAFRGASKDAQACWMEADLL